jgi:hypothetical protein
MTVSDFDITIGRNGEVELQCKGLNGRACLAIARLFEGMVGEIKRRQNEGGNETRGESAAHNLPENVGSTGESLL